MPLYRVLLEGRDFPGRIFGEPSELFGFFTTRFINAADPDAAELKAVESVREEYRDIIGDRQTDEPNPIIYLVEIEERDELPEGATLCGGGATWFKMREGD